MPIAKITKGTSPEGCLEYTLGKPDAQLLDTNCESASIKGIANEFELAISVHHRKRSRTKTTTNVVFHSSIGAPTGMQLDESQWKQIARYYIEGMGYDPKHHQYAVVRHNDRDHDHVHIVVNRVSLEGNTPNDWRDWKRAEVLMREIEDQFNLPKVASSEQTQVKAPTVGEVRMARNKGIPIPRVVMQQAIEECAPNCKTLEELQEQLARLGVQMTMEPMADKPQFLKLFFQYGESTFSASALGKRYTQKGLKEHFDIRTTPKLIKRFEHTNPNAATTPDIQVQAEREVNPIAQQSLINRQVNLLDSLEGVLKDLDKMMAKRSAQAHQQLATKTINAVFAKAWQRSRQRPRKQSRVEQELGKLELGSKDSGNRLYAQWLWTMMSTQLLEAGNLKSELDYKVAKFAFSQGYRPTTVIQIVSQSPNAQQLYEMKGLEVAKAYIQQVMEKAIQERQRYQPKKKTEKESEGR